MNESLPNLLDKRIVTMKHKKKKKKKKKEKKKEKKKKEEKKTDQIQEHFPPS
jgi:ribosomal protein L12E/L44/L45/RPP1/RPP2